MPPHLSPKDSQRKFAIKNLRESRRQALDNIQQARRSEKMLAWREDAEAELATLRREQALQAEIEEIDFDALVEQAENC